MAISSIGVGGGFQKALGGNAGVGSGTEGAQVESGGADIAQSLNGLQAQGGLQTQDTSGLADQTQDVAGISTEAQESSGAQAVSGQGSRAEQLTQALKDGLQAVETAQQGGGDASTALSELKQTYEQGEESQQIDQVDSEVKSQTEEALGLKGQSGGDQAQASAGADASGDGQNSEEQATYSSGVKASLDNLLGT